jgi:hypothetical protein
MYLGVTVATVVIGENDKSGRRLAQSLTWYELDVCLVLFDVKKCWTLDGARNIKG